MNICQLHRTILRFLSQSYDLLYKSNKNNNILINELQLIPGVYCLNFFCTRLSAHNSKDVVVIL